MRTVLALIACVMAAGLSSCSNGPTAPTSATITSPATETFSSLLGVKGTASRAFQTHNRGTISLTVTSTSPAGTAVGIGVGIPRANGTGCSLTNSVITSEGTTAQLSVTADVGLYCAQIYDPGTLGATTAFTMSITYQ